MNKKNNTVNIIMKKSVEGDTAEDLVSRIRLAIRNSAEVICVRFNETAPVRCGEIIGYLSAVAEFMSNESRKLILQNVAGVNSTLFKMSKLEYEEIENEND